MGVLNWILLGIGILMIASFAVIKMVQKVKESNSFYHPVKTRLMHRLLLTVGIVIVILSQIFVIVPSGNTGVKITTGRVDETTMITSSGFKWPFIEEIKLINNKQQDVEIKDKIWSETKQRTAIYYERIIVTFQISPERSAWICSHVTNDVNGLVTQPLVASAVKSSSKVLNDFDATNRSIIEQKVAENLQQSVNDKYGEGTIFIVKVTVDNVDFDESYNAAIAKKQEAQILYEQQQIENKKLLEKSEAEAQVKLKKAEAEAEANKKLQESLSDEVLKSKALDKWDGSLPKAVGSDTGLLIDSSDTKSK